MFNIEPLDAERWRGHVLDFSYRSESYYDVCIDKNASSFIVSFTKKPFEKTYENRDSDKLSKPWWEDVKAWGIVDGDDLSAVIETAVEKWNNRLRVTILWVAEKLKRQGVGTALMNLAKQRAHEEKRRAIILETQTCNEAALAFYFSQGFKLIGFDACCYANNDIDRKEVRMELGFFL